MKRSKYLQIRLTLEEKIGFESAANIAGIGLSAWARERLRITATKELNQVGQQASYIQLIPLKKNEK